MNTRLVFARFMAIVVLVIPGLMAMKGFLMMKDALFSIMLSMGTRKSHRVFSGFPSAEGLSCLP